MDGDGRAVETGVVERRVARFGGRRTVLVAVLLGHLAVSAFHGATHGLVPVPLAPWQNAVVALATFVGPVVGVTLAWREHPVGIPLFTVSMAGALAFGGYFHFVVENPDHVASVPTGRWQLAFQGSAVGVLLANALGAVVGVAYWRIHE